MALLGDVTVERISEPAEPFFIKVTAKSWLNEVQKRFVHDQIVRIFRQNNPDRPVPPILICDNRITVDVVKVPADWVAQLEAAGFVRADPVIVV